MPGDPARRSELALHGWQNAMPTRPSAKIHAQGRTPDSASTARRLPQPRRFPTDTGRTGDRCGECRAGTARTRAKPASRHARQHRPVRPPVQPKSALLQARPVARCPPAP
eukprot:601223-Rhodomonas_salina.1